MKTDKNKQITKANFFKKLIKFSFISLFSLSPIIALSNCQQSFIAGDDESVNEQIKINQDKQYGGVYFSIDPNVFNKKYEYGDAVTITFDNGEEYENVPYYSGYYVRKNDLVLTKEKEKIYLCRKMGKSIYEELGFDDKQDHYAKFSLVKRGQYKETQDLLNLKISFERKDYSNDETFANFRSALDLGYVKPNILFRSSSPIDDEIKRSTYSDKLAQNNNIDFFINLSQDENDIEKNVNKEEMKDYYFSKLWKEQKSDCCLALKMGMDFSSEAFAKKVVLALNKITDVIDKKADTHILIHCVKGLDRTGFVCVLLEHLFGVNSNIIEINYLDSYANLYKLNLMPEDDAGKKRNEKIIDLYYKDMKICILGKDDISSAKSDDFIVGAIEYLLSKGKMSKDDLLKFVEHIIDKDNNRKNFELIKKYLENN